MKVTDFTYELPPERIAQEPARPRDASRLLAFDRATGAVLDRSFRDLPELIEPGSLLVVNDTRVVPARLRGQKESGGKVELLLLCREGERQWEALLRASKKTKPGTRVVLDETASFQVLDDRGEGIYTVRLESEEAPDALVGRLGEMPLPPYIRRDGVRVEDRDWYQTAFAHPEKSGSAAAPTAGLHFTPEVLAALEARGVERATVTLHVGLGTFLPVRVEELDEHRMHRERFHLPAETADAIRRAKAEGRPVVAVGTTVTRVLEHCARIGDNALPEAGEGWTALFIRPGFDFRVVDGLLTNFHLPESTLLMLVCAFGGTEEVRGAYNHAVKEKYRFFSYGDAMLMR